MNNEIMDDMELNDEIANLAINNNVPIHAAMNPNENLNLVLNNNEPINAGMNRNENVNNVPAIANQGLIAIDPVVDGAGAVNRQNLQIPAIPARDPENEVNPVLNGANPANGQIIQVPAVNAPRQPRQPENGEIQRGRGARGGQERRRRYYERNNPYTRNLRNMADLMAHMVTSMNRDTYYEQQDRRADREENRRETENENGRADRG